MVFFMGFKFFFKPESSPLVFLRNPNNKNHLTTHCTALRRPEVLIMEYPSVETIERLARGPRGARTAVHTAFGRTTTEMAAAEAKRLNESHGEKMLILNFSEEMLVFFFIFFLYIV